MIVNITIIKGKIAQPCATVISGLAGNAVLEYGTSIDKDGEIAVNLVLVVEINGHVEGYFTVGSGNRTGNRNTENSTAGGLGFLGKQYVHIKTGSNTKAIDNLDIVAGANEHSVKTGTANFLIVGEL